ncbi:hypothetical protein N0V93_008899 [Gnomoniopsis smithogilvyi]|uniref:Uncharacterized protein n=1 Tax=Gnomoniopsis smithogilvyi TaxID=1191159 RepID=A0A9W9CT51_9PEZI|nr:hypothetical protein N0V93_008899 [Gnomoniopsis smithogilvyi]
MANPDVSNGTCYSSADSKSTGDFIPCGNVEFGDWPCCLPGNVCLSFGDANACWDHGTGNTYVAGCTDSNYVDKTCPQKLQFDAQQWVGLYQCGSSGNFTDWGGCENSPSDLSTLVKLPLANCTPYCSSTIFVGSSELAAYATVPSSAGGSITWTNAFNPTSTSRPPGTPPDPTDAANSSSSSSNKHGLSAGAKAGIGVASIIAGIVIITAIVALLIRRRRRRTQNHLQQPQQPGNGPYTDQYQGQSPPYPGSPPIPMASFPGGSLYEQQWQHVPAAQPYWVADANAKGTTPQDSAVYTGFKHELPAENVNESQQRLQTGSPRPSTIAPSTTGVSMISTNQDSQRQVGAFSITPQSTGTSGYFQENFGVSHLGPVSELGGQHSHDEGSKADKSPEL